jgi:hypothetical protein
MAALPWNPAAEVTDVTAAQSVQDRGGIKHNSYAFRDLRPGRRPVALRRSAAVKETDPTEPMLRQTYDEIVTAGWSRNPFRD